MLFEICLTVFLASSAQCSLVLDALSHTGIYVSDFCPKMKYCAEGAHIMCMYYDQHHSMGPKCRDARNVSITTGLANKLLDVTNALRSKISRGLEKGKNGERLPRGYGIFRLKWDNELATFAQVLANQCILRHDLCRATKRFPDPGQTAGIVRFNGPDWIPASKGGNFTTKGLDEEKLSYATTQTLRTWYGHKSYVTVPMVTNYPDWKKRPNEQDGRLYLTMIYGAATHMGCGISAYTDYAFYDTRASTFHNTVLVVCNFSAQPRPNAAVYNTVPPTDTDSSFNACGCPIGSLEDDDCLCLEVPREFDSHQEIVSQKAKSCPAGMNCDPTVVLLPIFTLEDAPPDKLVTSGRRTNVSLNHETEPLDSFDELFENNLSAEKGALRMSRKTLDLHLRGNTIGKRKRPSLHSTAVTERKQDFDMPGSIIEHTLETSKRKKVKTNEHRSSTNGHKDANHAEKVAKQSQGHEQRSSVFTNSPVFELPGSHYFLSTIKRDVIPRKDFSAAKQLVSRYLYGKNKLILPGDRHQSDHNNVHTAIKFNNDKRHNENIQHHEDVHFHDILTTETVLNTAEEKIMSLKDSDEINQSRDRDKSEGNTVTEENDKKFMDLLDILEKEVKHIELRDKEKQIFDAKIKKIYGKIVGKSANALAAYQKNHNHSTKNQEQKSEDEDSIVRILPPSYDKNNLIDELIYQTKPLTDTGNDEKYSKVDMDDFETDDIEKSMAKRQKNNYSSRDKYRRRNENYRQRNRNYVTSSELVRRRFDNGYKGRRTYKNTPRNDFEKLRHRSNSLDYKRNRNYYGNEANEELLSAERRRYYQDKLDSMERKLQNGRQYNRRKGPGRSPHMRAMKSSRPENQMNPLYTGRARILHGY